jgi:molybdate transport system ATP-binding protein
MSQSMERLSASSPERGHVMVSFRHVDVVAGGHQVLRDINWELRAGEHWGIVGANGSGKSSFLKLIAGKLAPASPAGRRCYDLGFGIQTDAVQAQHQITLVGHELQDRYQRLKWNFSALEVVLSGIFRTDVTRREPEPAETERARTLLGEIGLLRLAGRPFLELSRGEQRRVLLARSLAFEPKILLLDEPAAGLDARTRRVFNEAIERVSQDTTIVYTAHEARDLPSPINRIARISAGRIVESGPFRAKKTERGASGPRTESRNSTRQVPSPDHGGGEPALIEVTDADVWVGEARLLDGISWRLRNGEHWLVRGANGAGKSTFLRLLHGQFRAAKGGSIHWPGLGNPRSVWTLRRKIAWVSPELQAAYLYPSTVRACVTSGFESSIGLMRRPSADEANWVETLLDEFELRELAERPVAALSYGQMRRVLIVRALVNHPRVLLLDEPWEGLDTPTLKMLHRYLERIIAQGTQLVCASHVPRDLDCFTHEMEIADGRVVSINRCSDSSRDRRAGKRARRC